MRTMCLPQTPNNVPESARNDTNQVSAGLETTKTSIQEAETFVDSAHHQFSHLRDDEFRIWTDQVLLLATKSLFLVDRSSSTYALDGESAIQSPHEIIVLGTGFTYDNTIFRNRANKDAD